MDNSQPSFLQRWHNLNLFHKLTVGGLIILVLAFPIAVFLALGQTRLFPKAENPVTPPGETKRTATLSLLPASSSIRPDGEFTLAVQLDTGDYNVTGADVTVDYPINSLTATEVLVGPFLPVELETPILNQTEPSTFQNPTHQKVHFVAGSHENSPVSGIGTIALIKFKAPPTEQDINLFFNVQNGASRVSAVGVFDSVLGSTTPATVKVQKDVGTSLNIKVAFEGVTKQLTTTKKVKYTLAPATGSSLSGEATVSAANSTTFSGTLLDLTPGTYTLSLKGPVHLKKKIGSIVLSQGQNTEDLTYTLLLPGDTDGNDKIDIFDYNDIVADFGPRMPSGGSVADLDFDGDVDIFDYNLFVGNFAKVGEN